MPFHLAFTGSVTDFCMQKQDTEGYADHGKLLIRVATAIVYIKFIGNSVGSDGIFEHLLKVAGIVIVEQFASDQKSGMIVNDHDAVDAPGLTVFCNVWKVTGISLPDLTEFVFFIGPAVTEVRVSGRFEVVVADETLYGIHADSCREKGLTDQMVMDLCGIHAWVFFLNAVDFGNGILI